MRKCGALAEGNPPCANNYNQFTDFLTQRLVGTERNMRLYGKAEQHAENARPSSSQKIFAKQIFFASGCG